MKRKIAFVISVIAILAIAVIMIFSAYRSSESYRKKNASETYTMADTEKNTSETHTMKGTVLDISNGTVIAEPFVGEDELNSSDKFVISMEKMNSSPEPQVGDIIEVKYNGDIEETYPARLGGVISVSVVESGLDVDQEENGKG